jgi:hypothetical protein
MVTEEVVPRQKPVKKTSAKPVKSAKKFKTVAKKVGPKRAVKRRLAKKAAPKRGIKGTAHQKAKKATKKLAPKKDEGKK